MLSCFQVAQHFQTEFRFGVGDLRVEFGEQKVWQT